jgi:hypothetical protein
VPRRSVLPSSTPVFVLGEELPKARQILSQDQAFSFSSWRGTERDEVNRKKPAAELGMRPYWDFKGGFGEAKYWLIG